MCLGLLLAASALVPAQQPQGVPEGVKVLRGLEYVAKGHERQQLDLYLPEKSDGPRPLIIWIHGGAWRGGSKDKCPAVPFVARGYAVASINYRLSQHAVFPAQIEDCKAAVRWLRAHARKYGLDPERFGAWGASAGGHLAALLGTAGDVKDLEGQGGNLDQSSRVQAVVDWFGPTDLLKMGGSHDNPKSPESLLIGGPVQQHKEKAARANPITYVTRDDAPFLILHGDKDPTVPYNQSELLAEALKKAGVEVTLRRVAGAGHGGKDFNSPENRRLMEEFFDRHLKAARPAKGGGAKEARVESYIFKKTPQGELKIHVHFPADWTAKDRRPAIVFFFGGGWTGGSVAQFTRQAEYLAARGMVAARADYRVKSRHDVTPDKCVEDCKSAIRWLRQNATKLGIDPEKIAASGGSAGGHTAAAAFTTKGLEPPGEDLTISSKPNLLVLFNPALNTSKLVDRMGSEKVARQISPNDNLTRDVPPAIIFFGTQDKLLAHGEEYVKKAKQLGLRAELYTAEGMGHGFFNKSPWTEATLAQADRFLARHGYTRGEPTIKPSEKAALKLAEKSP
jgi:acetyl esterase/lipase